ncbi:hypothetical protein ACWEIJ_36420 [Lentzea sp. NPDC004789]
MAEEVFGWTELRQEQLHAFTDARIEYLFLSRTARERRSIQRLHQARPSLFVVDEADCVPARLPPAAARDRTTGHTGGPTSRSQTLPDGWTAPAGRSPVW